MRDIGRTNATITAAGWAVGLLVTALVLWSPVLAFGYRNPALHLMLDTVDACVALLVAYLVDRPGVHRLARPFVGVGVLGGWTTFSALAMDAVALGAADRAQLALGYVTATFLVGTLAVAAGSVLGRRVWPGP